MAITENVYTGNGSTLLFSISFPYLNQSDVKVTVNGTLVTNYSFANITTIQFSTAPANGAIIRIYRETGDDQSEATFFAGSSIKASDLNRNFLQTLYTVQEVVARYLNKVGDTMLGILNMGGFKITNLGAPTVATDASTKGYVDSLIAAATIPDIDYGDITVSNGATVWTIDNQAVTSAKIADGTIVNADVNASANIVASKLSFTQAGAGATARTVDSKLKDVVSVKDFGATGNGSTDDTAAIQAAINAALSQPVASGGAGTVFFPAGNYKVTSTINIPPRSGQSYNVGLRICGISHGGQGGSNCVISAGTGFSGTAVFKYDQGTIPISITDIGLEFDHLAILGNSNVQNGIEIFSPIGISIHEMAVTYCTGSCIKLTGGVDGGYSVDVRNIYITGSDPNHVVNPAVCGIESTARYALFERIVMDGSRTGLKLKGDNNIVLNCHLEGQATCIDVDATGGGMARITSCLLNAYGAGQTGWPTSGIGIKITGTGAGAGLRNFIGFNQIDANIGAASAGIYLDSAYQTQIFSNRVTGSVNGVYLTAVAAADRVHYIEGNNFLGCTNDINNQINGGRIELGGGNFGDTSGILTFSGYTSPVNGYLWGPQAIWARHGTAFTGTSSVDALTLYNGQTSDVNDAIRLKFDFSAFGPLSQARSASVAARSKLNYGNSTELVFSTAPNYGAEVERTIITKDGELTPAADNTYPVGISGRRWSVIYAATGTINTSDVNEKQQIEELSQTERTVATVIKGLIRKFKFNDAVAAKSDDARIHVGVIAQDVEQAFIDEGLDPSHYGLFCRDEWWELDGQIVAADEDGVVTSVRYELNGKPVAPDEEGNLPEGAERIEETAQATKRIRLGIRYEELFAFVLAAL